MYGDGVDPVEDELIDKTMAVHNLHVALDRKDKDLLAAQALKAQLAAAEAALERLHNEVLRHRGCIGSPGECIRTIIRECLIPAPAAEQATIKCDRCDGTGTLMNAAGKEYACDSCGGGGRFAKPSAPAGEGESQ